VRRLAGALCPGLDNKSGLYSGCAFLTSPGGFSGAISAREPASPAPVETDWRSTFSTVYREVSGSIVWP